VSTPTIRYYEYHHSRGGEVVKQLIGEDFPGVLGSDFYGGYNIHHGLHQQQRVRVAHQRAFEQRLWQLCQPFAHTTAPQHPLCERVERFVFVAVPGVPAHNNLAERSVRPLVIARKISGGTRSPQGSQTRMGLASLFGTWMAQYLNPFHQCLALLTSSSSLGQV
ncbi:MAG TPA: transposase, partial [Ktedonobacteraceae bacterium]